MSPVRHAVARVMSVAVSMAAGDMSPSVTPRRNPSRPLRSSPAR